MRDCGMRLKSGKKPPGGRAGSGILSTIDWLRLDLTCAEGCEVVAAASADQDLLNMAKLGHVGSLVGPRGEEEVVIGLTHGKVKD